MRRIGYHVREEAGMNMTPMIDIVFQMIIFFVCTVDLERKALNEKIQMAMAPHGPAEEAKDPRTVLVDVERGGRISIARVYMTLPVFQQIMRKVVAESGQNTPIVIRGDGATRHEDVRRVMDACSSAGIWKVKFAAIKEKAKPAQGG